MKATDFMIGDLVCYDGDTDYECPVKVDGVSVNDISLEEDGFLGGIEEMIRPIPLTEDILKVNGYKSHSFPNYDPYYRFIQLEDGQPMSDARVVDATFREEGILVYLRTDFYACYVGKAFVKYVHEFQHALRLCGFNDMADNFKVK